MNSRPVSACSIMLAQSLFTTCFPISLKGSDYIINHITGYRALVLGLLFVLLTH
jgi:hypothetical protein